MFLPSFFSRDHGPIAGTTGLSTVLVTALVNSCKKFLEMEKAASSASDRLADLTSMTGTWFLEVNLQFINQSTNQLSVQSVGSVKKGFFTVFPKILIDNEFEKKVKNKSR